MQLYRARILLQENLRLLNNILTQLRVTQYNSEREICEESSAGECIRSNQDCFSYVHLSSPRDNVILSREASIYYSNKLSFISPSLYYIVQSYLICDVHKLSKLDRRR